MENLVRFMSAWVQSTFGLSETMGNALMSGCVLLAVPLTIWVLIRMKGWGVLVTLTLLGFYFGTA